MTHQGKEHCFRTIGRNLRAMRLQRGLTQKNIGDMLGVSFQQIQKYETGKNKLPIENLLLLKSYYNADFETFFNGIRTTRHKDDEAAHDRENIVIGRLKTISDQNVKRKILQVIEVLSS